MATSPQLFHLFRPINSMEPYNFRIPNPFPPQAIPLHVVAAISNPPMPAAEGLPPANPMLMARQAVSYVLTGEYTKARVLFQNSLLAWNRDRQFFASVRKDLRYRAAEVSLVEKIEEKMKAAPSGELHFIHGLCLWAAYKKRGVEELRELHKKTNDLFIGKLLAYSPLPQKPIQRQLPKRTYEFIEESPEPSTPERVLKKMAIAALLTEEKP
jgi:hypothetical protein